MSGDPWAFSPSNVVNYGQRCTCPTAWWSVGPAPLCDYCRAQRTACAPWPRYDTVTATWPPLPQRLSDDDVDRIARRVAELLKGGATSDAERLTAEVDPLRCIKDMP